MKLTTASALCACKEGCDKFWQRTDDWKLINLNSEVWKRRVAPFPLFAITIGENVQRELQNAWHCRQTWWLRPRVVHVTKFQCPMQKDQKRNGFPPSLAPVQAHGLIPLTPIGETPLCVLVELVPQCGRVCVKCSRQHVGLLTSPPCYSRWWFFFQVNQSVFNQSISECPVAV